MYVLLFETCVILIKSLVGKIIVSLNIPIKSTYDFTEGFAYFFREAYLNALSWRWLHVTFILLVLLTFVCTRIAMLNILAYEFSALIAAFVCHFTAILVIREFDRLRPVLSDRSLFSPGPHPRFVVWGVIFGSVAAAGWLMLIPLMEIVILDLIFSIRNCDPLTGLGFYLTIPLISSFFAASVGAFCAVSTSTRRKAGWLYVLILLIFFSRIVIRIANGHVMSLHDPFLGLLALPLYEQETNLTGGYLYSRFFILLSAFLLMKFISLFADEHFQKYSIGNFFKSLRRFDIFLPEIKTFITFGLLFVLGLYYQGPLGMEITRRYLEHELDGRITTEHFIIRYPTGGDVEEDIERIAEDHEYYYWSIYNEIGVAPDGLIRAYIYPDNKTKTFLTGAGSNVYAKPWTGEIHVEYNRNRIHALKHELVHVISAPMGVPFFGSAMLGAYGEGIAEGVQWDSGNDLTYHQWAAALRVADDPYSDGSFFPRDTGPINLLTRNIREGGFYSGRIGMNYYLASSHTRWFLDTYGSDAYRRAYICNDTMSAIGVSREDAAGKWMEYLDHVPLTQDDIAYAGLAFSPPKFTVRVCAHELAEHQRLAREASQRSDWSDAYDEYGILLDFSPGNPRYAYEQVRLLYYQEKYEGGLNYINSIREWESIDEKWEPYLLVLEGDIYSRSGQPAMALDKYLEADDTALNRSTRETIQLRLAILNSPAKAEFEDAFREPDDARWRYERARTLDETWLPFYFLGSNLISDRMYDEAEEMFLECLRLNPPHSFVRRNCLYYLGICAYRHGEYSLAQRNFQDAGVIAADLFMQDHPSYDEFIPLDRLDSWSVSISDWLAKCVWRESWPGIQLPDEE